MFEEWLKIIVSLFSIIGVVIAAVPFLRKINDHPVSKIKGSHEIYHKINELVNKSIEINYAEILVLTNCITYRKLTQIEIRWFIKHPGAFIYLKDYGMCGPKYLEIDYLTNNFMLTPRIATTKKRIKERFKKACILLFFSFVISLILSFLYSNSDSVAFNIFLNVVYFSFIILAVICPFLMFRNIDKAIKLSLKNLGEYS